jgi:hypothetical protein
LFKVFTFFFFFFFSIVFVVSRVFNVFKVFAYFFFFSNVFKVSAYFFFFSFIVIVVGRASRHQHVSDGPISRHVHVVQSSCIWFEFHFPIWSNGNIPLQSQLLYVTLIISATDLRDSMFGVVMRIHPSKFSFKVCLDDSGIAMYSYWLAQLQIFSRRLGLVI